MKNKYSTKSVRRSLDKGGSTNARHSLLTRRTPATAGRRRLAEGGFINLRMLLALTLGLSGVALAIFSGKEGAVPRASQPERYMPVPGGGSQSEAAGLAQLEQYWHDRLTFPTGRFDPGVGARRRRATCAHGERRPGRTISQA